ncbi:Plasmodium exported protein, unknown function [Plasmodium berghei]|uniref:Gamete antigen 27/25 n=2 Tax=Plasmodium berghei TaxID=5821 RepID=A0A509AN46_PLABA|nr:Plasmodium exported protein, unknown function [Plasmodium berghei ANKA]CXI73857.1 Plasmodium exported protein, unknown function [Plasmodium berghei]VUC56970.1 Plasmodium exported protein, unknown function [Plasmodium berghei ANKA]|eukprot:XP_034422749.1 Plasmodium exported protein, unknown function [Plasmodium berghei ANKA]
MGAIKHKIFMVLKIVNIILSTQIPLNNNEINNFRKIIIPSPFKYPTRMLCCASFREKINKFCKTAFFCYKNQNYDNTQNDDKSMDYIELQNYDNTQNDDKSMDYIELQNYDNTQNDDKSMDYIELQNYDNTQNDDKNTDYIELQNYDNTQNDDKNTDYIELQNYDNTQNDDKSMDYIELQNYDNTQNDDKNMDYSRLLDYKENRDYDGWDGICKNKLYHIGNAAKRVDITLMNPSEIKKSFLPFRIDDEDIESYEVNELIHKIKSGEIIITPKIASLIFYDFHMNIYKDIQILYKRAQQRLNSLAIKYKFSSEKHALYKITLKKLIFRKSTNIMYRSLLIYEEYAVSYINELKLTFHIFLKQYCETICSIFKKIELAFFCGFSKLIVTVRRDQIRLIKEDEDELFFFT